MLGEPVVSPFVIWLPLRSSVFFGMTINISYESLAECHTVDQDRQKCKKNSNLDVMRVALKWINYKKRGEYIENKKKIAEYLS